MANVPSGGNIITQWLLKDDAALRSLNAGAVKVKAFTKTIQASIQGAASKIDSIGSKAVESAERFTFLAGAIFAPLALGVKNFAEKNDFAKQKITELQEKIKTAPTFAIPGIQKELERMQSIEKQTRFAAAETNKLAFAGKALGFELSKLFFETLQPYFKNIIGIVKWSIAWVNTNRVLAMRIVEVTAGLGALFLVLAPTLAIGGKLIRVFGQMVSVLGLLASPVGLLVAGVGVLAYIFREPLYNAIKDHLPQLQELWTSWVNGEITMGEAADKMVEHAKGMAFEIAKAINTLIDDNTGVFTALEDTLTNILIMIDRLKPWLPGAGITQAQAAINIADPRNRLPQVPQLPSSLEASGVAAKANASANRIAGAVIDYVEDHVGRVLGGAN